MRSVVFGSIILAKTIVLGAIPAIGGEPDPEVEEDTQDSYPPFSLLRAEEDFRGYGDVAKDRPRAKSISLNESRSLTLSLGGELRARGEFFSNRNWDPEDDEDFWSHRASVHGNLSVGQRFRFFGELYHGYTSHTEEFAESDQLAVHQGFAEVTTGSVSEPSIRIRAGRQELAFGSARLMGVREGPNIRRSFDAARATWSSNTASVDAFYGLEVLPSFGVFDNFSHLFESDENNPTTWGVYGQFKHLPIPGNTEIYYIGFDVNRARFNDAVGEEVRHTIGVRRFGRIGERFKFNTEAMYQFGHLGTSDIDAFNAEIDWRYDFSGFEPGFRFEWSSGDSNPADGEVNSYNPMFVNPEYYSLAKIITPVNVVSVQPFISWKAEENIELHVEYGWFWRESDADGLYRVTRFLSRDAGSGLSREIGQQIGIMASYEASRHVSVDLDLSYFFAGAFLDESGEAGDAFHFAPTIRVRF